MGGTSLTPVAIAAFILFLGILIFVHELGHFLAAKHFNIKVQKFSLGFGPPLFRFTRGDTTYQVALLPLGGYVKMLGDTPGEDISPEDKDRAFNTVPVHQRAIVAFAGPFMNLVFPVLCLFAYYTLGPTVISPVIGQMEVDSPAEVGGLMSGDRVLSVDGEHVWDFDQMAKLVRARPQEPTKFEVERKGQTIALTVTPRSQEGTDIFGDKETHGLIGVTPMRVGTRVGVDGPRGQALGFLTGDRVLKIGGKSVTKLVEVEDALAASAGQSVEVIVARPVGLASGDLLLGKRERPQALSMSIPAGAKTLADLDLASADAFFRYLEPEGPAARAGIREGDRVVAIEGHRVAMFLSFVSALSQAELKPVRVTVSRMGQRIDVVVKNEAKTVVHGATMKERPYYDSGIGLGAVPRAFITSNWPIGGTTQTETAQLSLVEALQASAEQTVDLIGGIMQGFAKLFTGGVSLKTVGGPLMLFQVAAEAAEIGLGQYLRLLAFISVNLGIMNLIPIPLLDGGHLLFCAIEAIKRKPVSMRVRETATIVGLVLLAVLIVVAFSNDVARFTDGFLN